MYLKGSLSLARPPTLRIGGSPVRLTMIGLSFWGSPWTESSPFYLMLFEATNNVSVFCPIIQYAQRVWIHRVEHSHVKKALRACPRSVLLCMGGAYRTVSFQALSVILGQAPLDLVVQEAHAIWQLRHGHLNRPWLEAKRNIVHIWQAEWDEADTGRYTHGLIPVGN